MFLVPTERFPSWAKALLVLLAVGLLVGALLVHFRQTTPDLPKDATVRWDCSYRTVHLYENRSDQPEKQHQDYKDRTEMKKDLLKTGDLSLTLKYPKETDTGRYRCEVYNQDGNRLRVKRVKLEVKGQYEDTEQRSVCLSLVGCLSLIGCLSLVDPLNSSSHLIIYNLSVRVTGM
uniref:Ig-like domain-containing protein n=1 Tax=Sparus aurata TaxID=8175 RepID=A0A671VFB7_SPAAU